MKTKRLDLKHALLALVGALGCLVNLCLIVALYQRWVTDIYFMWVALSGPWAVAALFVGLSPAPRRQAVAQERCLPEREPGTRHNPMRFR